MVWPAHKIKQTNKQTPNKQHPQQNKAVFPKQKVRKVKQAPTLSGLSKIHPQKNFTLLANDTNTLSAMRILVYLPVLAASIDNLRRALSNFSIAFKKHNTKNKSVSRGCYRDSSLHS